MSLIFHMTQKLISAIISRISMRIPGIRTDRCSNTNKTNKIISFESLKVGYNLKKIFNL